MIYLPSLEMIFGELPNEEQVSDETPEEQPKPEKTTTTTPDPNKMTVDRKYIESLRQEAEKNRKALDALKTQQEEAEKKRKLDEMTELDRLKAQITEIETKYNTEKQARETEQKKALLVNISASMGVALPNLVVNQISADTLKSLDLNDTESFKNQIQNVITEAETAGISLIRTNQSNPIPSPPVGPTNPANPNYPRPRLTNDQELAQLRQQFIEAASNGDYNKRDNIQARIRQIEMTMGTTIPKT